MCIIYIHKIVIIDFIWYSCITSLIDVWKWQCRKITVSRWKKRSEIDVIKTNRSSFNDG